MDKPRTPSALPRHRPTLEELSAIALGADPRRMSLRQLYFRTTGRIPRRTFWLHGVLSLLAIGTLGNVLLDIAGLANDNNGKLLNLLLAWPVIAVSVKRQHDFNLSAWWTLVNLVPGFGSIAMLVVNGLVPGTRGANRYGADPLDPPAGFALNTAH